MPGIYQLRDELDRSVRNLSRVEARVRGPSPTLVRAYYPPRVRFGSPGFWENLKGWITALPEWTGPLISLYSALAQAGIISSAEAARAQQQGLTREEVLEMIRATQVEKPFWQNPYFLLAMAGLMVSGAGIFYAARKKAE